LSRQRPACRPRRSRPSLQLLGTYCHGLARTEKLGRAGDWEQARLRRGIREGRRETDRPAPSGEGRRPGLAGGDGGVTADASLASLKNK
jgi:hypothetical protein